MVYIFHVNSRPVIQRLLPCGPLMAYFSHVIEGAVLALFRGAGKCGARGVPVPSPSATFGGAGRGRGVRRGVLDAPVRVCSALPGRRRRKPAALRAGARGVPPFPSPRPRRRHAFGHGHRPGGGARSPREASTHHRAHPAAIAGADGVPGTTAVAVTATAAAAIARAAMRRGRPRRMRAGRTAAEPQSAGHGTGRGAGAGGRCGPAARSARASDRPHGVRSWA